jgi:hypothetical protein
MRRNITVLIFISLFSFSSLNFAQDYGASIKVSTLGFTVEGMRSFGPDFNARLGASFFSISQDGGGGTDEFEYTAEANLTSISILGDYFPFGQTFRLTGGILINLNKADLEITPTESYTIGGDEYTPDLLGSMSSEIDFNKIAPYIGIGLGNPMGGDSGLKFSFDIGTIYQGSPNVGLSATGLIEPSASQDQEELLEENMKWFQWYPVVTFGLTYKF